MPARYRSSFYKLLPSWLTDGEGELVGYSLGVVMDAWMTRLYQGLLARWPDNAPDDAVASIGRDRKIVRGINESRTSYAVRLKRWLTDHSTRGNPFTLMDQVHAYLNVTDGIVLRTVDNRGNWYTRAADGTRSYTLDSGEWNWDGDSASWARFWLIIYPAETATEGVFVPWSPEDLWGVGTWGDGGTWGSSATPDEIESVRSLVREWQPEHAENVNILISYDSEDIAPGGASLPDGTWSTWAKSSGGVVVAARAGEARYVDGATR